MSDSNEPPNPSITLATTLDDGEEDLPGDAKAELSPERLSEALARLVATPEGARRLHGLLGQYCHQYRNSLNTLKISLYLSRRASEADPSHWDHLDTAYNEAEEFVERLQASFRPQTLTLLRVSLGLLFDGRRREWESVLETRGRSLILQPPPGNDSGCFDPSRLEQAFNDLVAWRAVAGPSHAGLRVAWRVDSERFLVTWDEPSLAEDWSVSSHSIETDRTVPSSLAALALPQLSRAMALHGGSLSWPGQPRKEDWSLTLEWPTN